MADAGLSTDAELWQRAAGGDRAAFGKLFERHVEAMGFVIQMASG
ncbi:hypothetical protein [Actinophytocola sp.]|nr:hypothetical protein [Actinophytocola sp.]